MSDNTDLSVIDEITPAKCPEIFGQGKVMGFYERVKKEVGGEAPDLDTAKGRARVASLAAKVSKSKVAIEKPGRDYLREIKRLPKTIEAELREFVRAMDDLRDETRKPLTEWEEAEEARKDAHREAIEFIRNMALPTDEDGEPLPSESLKEKLAELNATKMGDQWEEFEGEAARAKEQSFEELTAAIERQERREAEQAELDRLRKEEAEKAEREREERIRKEAIEAERKAAKEKAEAEEKAKREAGRLAEAERQRELDEARREKAEAELRAERAAAEERSRIEAERAAAEKEAERKAANKRHRAKIDREVLADLVKAGADEALAKSLVEAIARGQVRHMTINY